MWHYKIKIIRITQPHFSEGFPWDLWGLWGFCAHSAERALVKSGIDVGGLGCSQCFRSSPCGVEVRVLGRTLVFFYIIPCTPCLHAHFGHKGIIMLEHCFQFQLREIVMLQDPSSHTWKSGDTFLRQSWAGESFDLLEDDRNQTHLAILSRQRDWQSVHISLFFSVMLDCVNTAD